MPIVIKKGSDLIKKKKSKSLKKSLSQESCEDVVDFSNVARDMTDVLDFKIYHIIKPNFYNDKERVNLIGEAYYQQDEEESSVQKLGGKSPRGKILQTEQQPPRRVLLNDTPKLSFEEMGYVDMFTRIKANEKDAAAVKIGTSIGKLLDPPTQEEALKWAIRYVAAHSDKLTLHVIDLYYQLKSYEGNLESIAKNYKSERPRAGSDDMHGRDRTVSNFSEGKEHARDRTVSKGDASLRSRTASESSGGGGGGGGVRRASSRQLSATGSSDPLLGAAGDRLNASQQVSRSKNVSLAQQLEQIKAHGTDAFIRAISPHKEPIFAHGKKHWKVSHHQTSSKASLDSTAAPVASTASTAKPWENARKVSVMVSSIHKMHPGGGGHVDSAASLIQPAPPTGARPSSHNTSSGNPRTDGRSTRPQVSALAAVAAMSATSSLDSPSPTTSPRPAEAVAPREERKAADTLVNHSQRMLAALLKKTTAVQAEIAVRIRKAEKKGARVQKLSRDFRANVESGQMKAACLFEEKEITKAMRIAHEVECYDDQNRDDMVSQGLLKDMRKMHEQAERLTQAVQIERLLQHRWFLALVVKLREYMKKMNNAAPPCCLRFVTAVQQVILLGHTLSQAGFYSLLEATVTAKEDHSKTIVHQLLKIARDIVDVSASDFLAYLEGRDINPNPELVNQVRALAKLRKAGAVTSTVQGAVLTTTLAVPLDAIEGRAPTPGELLPGPETEGVLDVDIAAGEGFVGAVSPVEPPAARSGSGHAPARPGRMVHMASVAGAVLSV